MHIKHVKIKAEFFNPKYASPIVFLPIIKAATNDIFAQARSMLSNFPHAQLNSSSNLTELSQKISRNESQQNSTSENYFSETQLQCRRNCRAILQTE